MLKLSKKVEYGLMAVLHMDAARGHGLVTSKEIAEAYDIPSELLGKVLQKLAKAGIVESVQGSRGGYELSRPLEELTLGQVVQWLDGPVNIVPCCDGSTTCRQHATCNIKNPVQQIQEDVVDYISGLSLGRFRAEKVVRELRL